MHDTALEIKIVDAEKLLNNPAARPVINKLKRKL